MNGFEILSKLGEGAYSVVHKVKRIEDGKIYALKKVKLLNLTEKEKQNSINEVRILASVKSAFVISYKEAFLDENESCLCIVMEYADKGDLYQKISQFKNMGVLFEEIDAWRIFLQMAKGLKALHDLKILHRDLKSANIFLFSDGTAKLGDLNVSKVARKGLGYTQTGTPYYASPEVWKDQPYDSKSDVWSLGCVTYEMLSLKPPFRAENMEGLYNKVIKGQYNKLTDKYSSDMNDLIRMLLQVIPEARPSCTQILKHPIIQKRIEFFKANISSAIDENEEGILLQTIRIPKNLLFLTDKLPGSNYDSKKKNNIFLPPNPNPQRNKKNISFPSVGLPDINIPSIKTKKKMQENDKEKIADINHDDIIDNGYDHNQDNEGDNNNNNNNNNSNSNNTKERQLNNNKDNQVDDFIKKPKKIERNNQIKELIMDDGIISPHIQKIELKPVVKKKNDEYYGGNYVKQKMTKNKEIAKYIQNVQNIYQIYCPAIDSQNYHTNRYLKDKKKILDKIYHPIYYNKNINNNENRSSRGKIIPNRKLSPLKNYIIK